MSSAEASGPNKAALGWLEHGNRRDAVDYAKGYALKHFDAPALCWFAVMPFVGGWLFEIQEGGPGRSHLGSVAKALAEGGEQSWFRVGTRAYSVSMRDGRPFCVLLPATESKALLASETGKLVAKGAMTRVIRKGTGVLVFGGTFFLTGLIFLSGATGFYALRQHFVPSERIINTETLPHRQWERVHAIPPNLYVESLKLDAGADQWKTAIKPLRPPRPAEQTPAQDDPVAAVPVPEPSTQAPPAEPVVATPLETTVEPTKPKQAPPSLDTPAQLPALETPAPIADSNGG